MRALGIGAMLVGGSARPVASVVNYEAREVRAGSTLIQLGSGGYVGIYSSRSDAGSQLSTTPLAGWCRS